MYAIRKNIPFIIYYQDNNLLTILDDKDVIRTITKQEKIKMEEEYNFFEMFQSYKMTEKSMKQFKKDFIK